MHPPFSSNRDRALITGTIIQRPGDTASYAKGDLVDGSTDPSGVTPIIFEKAGPFGPQSLAQITRARIWKSSTEKSNAEFKLHIFGAAPTSFAGGDNAPLSCCGSNYYGFIDAVFTQTFLDGAYAIRVPSTGTTITARVDSAIRLYGLLEAVNAYTPASGELYEVFLDIA